MRPRPARVVESCPAKVNLFLEVLGTRPDGYRELATVMAPVSLADEIELSRARRDSLEVSPGEAAPAGPDNTVRRALAELRKLRRVPPLRIVLRKRIPSGAGLGGGSSDAAGLLRAADRLLGLGLGIAEQEAALGRIGSDTAFFARGATALCTGRGELVHPLVRPPRLRLVLLLPPYANPTAEVYRRLGSSLTQPRASVIEFLNTLASGGPSAVARALFNRLEAPAFAFRPELSRLRSAAQRLLGTRVRMSGSGSSLFVVGRDRQDQARLARRAAALPVRVVRVESPP